jgi:cytochrome c oxidase subunit II
MSVPPLHVVASTDTRSDYTSLEHLTYVVLGIAALLVVGAITLAIVRRHRPARPASDDSHRLQIAWIGLVAVGVVVLATATMRAEGRTDTVTGTPQARVEVTAFKWGWRFRYPGSTVDLVGSTNGAPTLTVPAGERVRFVLTSRDVIHSFFIPQTRFKRDAFPARTTTFDLVFSHPGVWPGRCAEYCGLRHAEMDFTVRAVPAAQYRAWLAGGGRS